ncbi:hypothetical protein [Kitasatospora sp. NPDC089509]|uniref:hypothetical protein n=1 Tax=Kitasatospora sp. NPDC089509 TaxID=3364079 RepID=UPI0038040DA0
MSTESWPGDLGEFGGSRGPWNGDAEAAEAAVSWELGELADSVEAGPVPYERLLDGGRRRLRRRRLLTAAAVAMAVALVGGAGAVTAGGGYRPGGSPVAVPPASSASLTAAPATGTPSAAPSGTARDPFTPVRVKVGEGISKGRALEAWIALWPAAPTAEAGREQGRRIWEERHAVDPHLPPDPEPSALPTPQRGVLLHNPAVVWDPHKDRADIYLIVDGKREPGDYVDAVPAPGGTTPGEPDDAVNGVLLTRLVNPAASSPEMVVVRVGPEVAKVEVDWKAGGAVSAVPVGVGDSTSRWYAVVRTPGAMDNTVTSFAEDGTVLRTQNTWW